MKKKETKEALPRLLAALAFAVAALTAVLSFAFVWFTAFVYRDNIRGYVPAGLGALMWLGIATLVLLFHLTAVARRHHASAVPYLAAGCLAAPTAVFVFRIYSTFLISFVGEFSWQKDVTISAVGGAVCTVMAIVFHRAWLSKKTDNNTSELTSGGRADASPGGSST